MSVGLLVAEVASAVPAGVVVRVGIGVTVGAMDTVDGVEKVVLLGNIAVVMLLFASLTFHITCLKLLPKG